MKHCLDDSAVGAVIDVPISDAHAYPYCPISTAKLIVLNLGVLGFCFVRTPYVPTFLYAGSSVNVRLSSQHCFRSGISMHRITRVA